MPKFKISDLPPETKNLHESQNKWRTKNWLKTLANHKDEIEKMIQKLNLFDIWSNRLHDINAAKMLIPEIFMDAYVSIHFASYGLYKYANMCLRSELETALRLVFFSTHEVEFRWWQEGDEWYREKQNYPDIWGRGYTYFEKLKEIKDFESSCEQTKKLFAGKEFGVRGVHKKLSKFIHSGAGHFQTRPDRVSPKYDLAELKRWIKTYEQVQTYIHIIFSLAFADKFKTFPTADMNNILDSGMNQNYKEKVKGALNI